MHDAAASRVTREQQLAGGVSDLEDVKAFVQTGSMGRGVLLGAAIQINILPAGIMHVFIDNRAIRCGGENCAEAAAGRSYLCLGDRHAKDHDERQQGE
jgi:hypothetical protein